MPQTCPPHTDRVFSISEGIWKLVIMNSFCALAEMMMDSIYDT